MSAVSHLARKQTESTSYDHVQSEDVENNDSDCSTELEVKQDSGRVALQIEEVKPMKRHWGNNCICFPVRGEPFLTLGPHWPLFLCTLSVMMGVGGLVIWVACQKKDSTWFKCLTISVVCWQGFIYSLTACRNPGILTHSRPTTDTDLQFRGERNYCKICKTVKKDNTYHCEDCDVCIEEYDHHCPWTGKCIGKGNIVPFYMFLGSTMVYIMYCMFACVHAVVPDP